MTETENKNSLKTKAMKTRNNVRKAILSLAVIFSGLLIAGITSAVGSDSKLSNINPATIRIENVADEKLAIESWMTSESIFLPGTSFYAATDRSMVIEAWMFDGNSFTSGNLLEEPKDEPVVIESWMTSDALFTSATAALAPATDHEMKIEGWMVDESNFNTKATIEEKPAGEKKIEIWKVKNEKYGNRLFILTEVKDKEIRIENWMLDNNYW